MSMLALALLLLGQCALAVHETDQRQHAPGSHCEWCIAGTTLHAVLGADAPVLSFAGGARHTYAAHPHRVVRSFHVAVYLGRAPPLFSC
ncbi:MAG: hypothetical protein ACOY9J_00210 [Pseudomonadota bacterium]